MKSASTKKKLKAKRTRAKSYLLAADPRSDDFLKSYQWRELRMQVLKKFGVICQCCGAKAGKGIQINVDHVKPRKKIP